MSWWRRRSDVLEMGVDRIRLGLELELGVSFKLDFSFLSFLVEGWGMGLSRDMIWMNIGLMIDVMYKWAGFCSIISFLDVCCVCMGGCSVVGEGDGEDSVDEELVSKESCFVRVLSTQIVPPEKRLERRGYLRSEERLVSNRFNSG